MYLFHISAIEIFTSPKEMISYYWQKIKDNGQLTDALDLVRGQKRQKAFDYTFSTVEGIAFKIISSAKVPAPQYIPFVPFANNSFQELSLQTITNRSFTMSLINL